jgi:Cu/Ag efflux protein CusF
MKQGKRRGRVALVVAVLLMGGATATSFAIGQADAASDSPTTYRTRGVVKSFGPERAYVNVAHEKIEGYMDAMTMSFEPKSRAQFTELAPGDIIEFSFVSFEDGRRVIDTLSKVRK